MSRIINIGTQEYTKVVALDEPEFNANHKYVVNNLVNEVEEAEVYASVRFQKGPIKENGVNGCHNEDLIAIVIDRLQHLNVDKFRCRENSTAITKLEEALMWLRKRTDDRKSRNVEGTSNV